MEFSYKLKNLENLSSKELEKFKTKLGKMDKVVSAKITDQNECQLSCQNDCYEYDILQTLLALADEFNVEVIFGEDADNGPIDVDLDNSNPNLEENLEEETSQNTEKADEVLDYEDKLYLEKKTFKKDSLFRLGELSVSLVLLIVSLFFKMTTSVFSVKMILLILSFSISGYDIIFNAGLDIVKRRPLNGNITAVVCSVLMLILGQSTAATLFMWLFAGAKFAELVSTKIASLKEKQVFYLGTTPINVNGEEVKPKNVKAGDVITLTRGQVVPVDGILQGEGEVSSYTVDYSLTTEYKNGDLIKAGSIVLSESLTFTASYNYGEGSYLNIKQNTYNEKRDNFVGKKLKKVSKIGLYADLCVTILAILFAFLMPLTTQNYVTGLEKYGLIAVIILATTTLTLTINNLVLMFKNLYADGYSACIDFDNLQSALNVGNANSLKAYASQLSINGKLKEDSLAALKELNLLGIKKISTQFDCDLNQKDKDSIDFVEPTVKNEKQIVLSEQGDIGLNCQNVNILNGEVSYIPLGYKMSKKVSKWSKVYIVLSIAIKIALILSAFLIPNTFNIAYLAVGGALLDLILALLTMQGFTKNK